MAIHTLYKLQIYCRLARLQDIVLHEAVIQLEAEAQAQPRRLIEYPAALHCLLTALIGTYTKASNYPCKYSLWFAVYKLSGGAFNPPTQCSTRIIKQSSFSHAVILERHTARDIHRNIIQRSNSGMPASTNVHLSVDKSISAYWLVQWCTYPRNETLVHQQTLESGAK